MRARIWIVFGALVGVALAIWLWGSGSHWGSGTNDSEPAQPAPSAAEDPARSAEPTPQSRRERRRATPDAVSEDGVAPLERTMQCAAALKRLHRAEHLTLIPLFGRRRHQMSRRFAAGFLARSAYDTALLEGSMIQLPTVSLDMATPALEAAEMSIRSRESMLRTMHRVGVLSNTELAAGERALSGARDAAAWLIALARANSDPVRLPTDTIPPETDADRALLPGELTREIAAARAELARAFLAEIEPIHGTDPPALRLHALLAQAHTGTLTYEEAAERGRALIEVRTEPDLEERGALGLLEWYAGPPMAELRAR